MCGGVSQGEAVKAETPAPPCQPTTAPCWALEIAKAGCPSKVHDFEAATPEATVVGHRLGEVARSVESQVFLTGRLKSNFFRKHLDSFLSAQRNRFWVLTQSAAARFSFARAAFVLWTLNRNA